MDMTKEDAALARAGWYGLLKLLQAKGLITEAEVHMVIQGAYREAEGRLHALLGKPPSPSPDVP